MTQNRKKINDRSVFHLISDITEKEDVPCVLIGGFAVNYYKVSRNTNDIDFLLMEEDFKKISHYLDEAGYKQISSHENFAQFKSTRLSLMNVDFMFVEKETLTKILNESREIKIAHQKFIVPSVEHLIALKLHAIKYQEKLRFYKDFPDILNLIKANQINIKNENFKIICLKFGSQEIYQKILEALE